MPATTRITAAILAAVALFAGVAHTTATPPGQPTAMRGNDCCY